MHKELLLSMSWQHPDFPRLRVNRTRNKSMSTMYSDMPVYSEYKREPTLLKMTNRLTKKTKSARAVQYTQQPAC